MTDGELADLLARSGRGDTAAFEALYGATAPKLNAVVRRLCSDVVGPDDVLQDTYMTIWAAADRFDPERGKPMAWMIAVARNTAIDRVRREIGRGATRTMVPLDAVIENLPALTGSADQDTVALRRCLRELSDPERLCVVLGYVEGYTHAELADRLARPMGTVKSWMRRGLEKLKGCLER